VRPRARGDYRGSGCARGAKRPASRAGGHGVRRKRPGHLRRRLRCAHAALPPTRSGGACLLLGERGTPRRGRGARVPRAFCGALARPPRRGGGCRPWGARLGRAGSACTRGRRGAWTSECARGVPRPPAPGDRSPLHRNHGPRRHIRSAGPYSDRVRPACVGRFRGAGAFRSRWEPGRWPRCRQSSWTALPTPTA
jgi:hypothetical protein